MALVGVELESLFSEPDALTTRPPPQSAQLFRLSGFFRAVKYIRLISELSIYPERNIFHLWYLAKYQIKCIFLS